MIDYSIHKVFLKEHPPNRILSIHFTVFSETDETPLHMLLFHEEERLNNPFIVSVLSDDTSKPWLVNSINHDGSKEPCLLCKKICVGPCSFAMNYVPFFRDFLLNHSDIRFQWLKYKHRFFGWKD